MPKSEDVQSAMIVPMFQNDITPEWLLYEQAPGDVVNDEVLIYNPNKDTSLTVHLHAVDSTVTSEGDFALLPVGDERNEALSTWISIEEDFELEPGEWERVPFTVSVPADAEEGEYSGGIVMLMKAMDHDFMAEDGPIAVDYQVGLRMYMDVKEDAVPLTTSERELTFSEAPPYFLWMGIITTVTLLLICLVLCFNSRVKR